MFKYVICIMFLLLYVQNFTYIDLSEYQSEEIQVEIKGEVNNPDSYVLPYESTIEDLIEIADGVTKSGDILGINLNQPLHDKDVIVIPEVKEETLSLVSLNSATLEELTTLEGIGPAMAQRIIDYRNSNTFQRIEDIMLVKGIKEKLFAKIKDRLTL